MKVYVVELINLYSVSKCHNISISDLIIIMVQKNPGMEPVV